MCIIIIFKIETCLDVNIHFLFRCCSQIMMNSYTLSKLSCSRKPFLLLTHVTRECYSEMRPKRGPGFCRNGQHDHRKIENTPRTSKVP